LDQWWHGSKTHFVEDTSLLTCNGNVSSGKEAAEDSKIVAGRTQLGAEEL